MFSYYGDLNLIEEVEHDCPYVHYVPWCTEMNEVRIEVPRNRNIGIYMGSLEAFKNAGELVSAILLILNQTATEKFIVVGPGSYAPQIKQLAVRFGERLEYIESLSRPEAMRLLRSAGYGYTPVSDCGLGFIGDCWGTGTPLVTTHNLEGFLKKDNDSLIAENVNDLPRVINTLLSSELLYKRIQQGGLRRYESNHTARAVGEKYLAVIREVIQPSR